MSPRPLARAATVAALLVAAACSGDPAPPARAPDAPQVVRVARVELRALAGATTASGLLVAREEAAVGVEQAGVRVLRVLVEEGAQVEAGQPLAELDDVLLRQRLVQARAEAENAAGAARRVDGLDGTGVMSEEEIADRRSSARVAQAQLQELESQARQMTVRAPVAGVVVERTVRPGSLSGAEPMFRIVRDNAVELDAEVPEAAMSGIAPGQPVAVTLADGSRVDGTVRLVVPRIDPETKLGRVRVALPRDDGLRVGGFARGRFAARGAPVATVPEQAVQYEASGPRVMVIDGDDRARRVEVKSGRRSGGLVELVTGPRVGTRVALAGGAFLVEGERVRPEAAAPAPAPRGQPASPDAARAAATDAPAPAKAR